MLKKTKFFIDQDKEEKFINDMCSKGFALKNVHAMVAPAAIYEFEECQPLSYVYRLDTNPSFNAAERKVYLDKLSLDNIELVTEGKEYLYLRKYEDFDLPVIYTDLKISFFSRKNSRYNYFSCTLFFLLLIFSNLDDLPFILKISVLACGLLFFVYLAFLMKTTNKKILKLNPSAATDYAEKHPKAAKAIKWLDFAGKASAVVSLIIFIFVLIIAALVLTS